jgi:hypothetical protein
MHLIDEERDILTGNGGGAGLGCAACFSPPGG